MALVLLGRFCCWLGIVLLRFCLGWEGVFPWSFFVVAGIFVVEEFLVPAFFVVAVFFFGGALVSVFLLNGRVLFLGSLFFWEAFFSPQ